jgi:predicted pyridoxine 5'-phosphate oxidase superfamily flavin-nucleotide-binding protein
MMGMLTQEIREFVRKSKLGFIATVCPDGTPNLSPKGTTIVWDEDHLAFADIHSPGTVQNLLSNPAIEINVVDVFTRKGYRFKGTAKVFSEGRIFNAVISFYGEAASKYKINHIVLVKVNRVLEITSPIYDTGLSEEEVKIKYIAYWASVYPK